MLVVLNKIDLLGAGYPSANSRRPGSVSLSAATGEGIAGLKAVIRSTVLSAPDVAILRVPLDEPELVQRAVSLPHQLARRFENGTVELAVRVDPRFLVDAGLTQYRVGYWGDHDGEGVV